MLWVTGVLGLIGAGAASLITFPTAQSDQDEEQNPQEDIASDSNLLDLVDGPKIKSGPEEIGFAEAVAAALSSKAATASGADNFTGTHDEIVLNTTQPLNLEPFQMIQNQAPEPTPANTADTVSPSGAETPEEVAQNSAEGVPTTPSQDTFYLQQTVDVTADNRAESELAGATHLEQWISEGRTGEVLDYAANREQLMLVWDDLAGSSNDPDVDVADDPFDPDIKHITMNGKHMAEVYGDPNLNAGDIAVIPLSSALIIGFEPS